MQRRLPIENKYIAILQVPVNLLVHRGRAGVQATLASSDLVALWCHELVGDRGALLNSEFVLRTNVSLSEALKKRGKRRTSDC